MQTPEFVAFPGASVRCPMPYMAASSRTVSDVVLSGVLDLGAVSAIDDWADSTSNFAYGPGEVFTIEAFHAKTWAGVQRCRDLATDWAEQQGVGEAFRVSEVSALACAGSSFHHDAVGFPGVVFCIVWLSEDANLDMYLPHIDRRIPLRAGTIVLFDSAQPHGVVERGSKTWCEKSYGNREEWTQFFLSWDLDLTANDVARTLQIELSQDVLTDCHDDFNPRVNGAASRVHPDSGAWIPY